MNLRVIEMEFLKWLESIRTDYFTQFIHVINFTGDVMFFTIMLPIIYWLFSKRSGIILSLMLFTSLFFNVLLKDIFQVLRPFQAYDITSTVEQSGYSFPSGHSQHSFAFWTMLALFLRKPWFWLLSVAMIILVGFARMYSGVHYPLDVIGGWLIGILIVSLFYTLQKRNLLLRINKTVLVLGGVCCSIIGLLIYELFTQSTLDHEGVYQAAGLFLFAIVGYVLESQFVKFEIKTSIIAKIGALLVGLAGLLLIKEGIKLILPNDAWSDFLRYGLLALWTIYLAPQLFVWLNFAYRKY